MDYPNNPCGSIPAWAGKPNKVFVCNLRVQVHPRVGGETFDWLKDTINFEGPSPRGRGNLRVLHVPSPA